MSGVLHQALDPRNTQVTHNRKLFLELSYFLGHMVMCGGLVVAAGATREAFTQLIGYAPGSTSELGSVVGTAPLIELYAGIAICLLGQAMLSYFTTYQPDLLRLGSPVLVLALIPVLAGLPAVAAILAMTIVCAALVGVDRRRRTAAAATAAGPGRAGPARRRWGPAIRFTGRRCLLSRPRRPRSARVCCVRTAPVC